MYNRDGRPTAYDYQRSGIASVTIRPTQEGKERLLSREDTQRVTEAVEKNRTQKNEKK